MARHSSGRVDIDQLRHLKLSRVPPIVADAARFEAHTHIFDGHGRISINAAQGTRTAAPFNLPLRRSSNAILASAKEYSVVSVTMPTLGTISKNSTPSLRVRLATDTICLSSHRILYGKLGISLI